MSEFFKKETHMSYEVFVREMEKAAQGLHIMRELVKTTNEFAQQSQNSQEILESMRKISTFSNLVQKTNTNFDLILAEINPEIFNQLTKIQPAVQQRCKNFIRSDLSDYNVGDKIKVMILHIVNSKQNMCFVRDVAKNRKIEFSDCIVYEYESVPEVGVMFAVKKLDGKFSRASRIDAVPTNEAIQIRLIDTGETISISPDTIMYALSIEAQNVPPMGFMCRIERIDGRIVQSLDLVCKQVAYDAHVISVNNNNMVLDLHLSPSIDEEKQPLNISINEGSSLTSISPNLNVKQSKNPFLFDDEDEASIESSPIPKEKPPVFEAPPIPPRRPQSAGPKMVSNRIVKQNIGPKCTNMEITVKNIGNGEMNSSKPNENGDKSPTKPNGTDIKNCETGTYDAKCDEQEKSARTDEDFDKFSIPKLEMPAIGSEISIIPSYFQSLDIVYVNILPTDPRFDELGYELGMKANQLTPLKYTPRVGEYVLARYSVDNGIYRAKVVNIVDHNTITIFYADYGNKETLTLDSLYELDPICLTIPLQAICCRLDNIHRLIDIPPEFLFEYMSSRFMNRSCKAEILAYDEDKLVINLKTLFGVDIADEIREFYQNNKMPISSI